MIYCDGYARFSISTIDTRGVILQGWVTIIGFLLVRGYIISSVNFSQFLRSKTSQYTIMSRRTRPSPTPYHQLREGPEATPSSHHFYRPSRYRSDNTYPLPQHFLTDPRHRAPEQQRYLADTPRRNIREHVTKITHVSRYTRCATPDYLRCALLRKDGSDSDYIQRLCNPSTGIYNDKKVTLSSSSAMS